MKNLPRSVQWLALAVLVTLAVSWVLAHEGHEPLPSRGATVNVQQGQVILTAESREALDVQTVEIQRGSLPQTALAYATLTAPWKRHAFVASRLAGRIVRLHVQPGEVVQAGQLLAEVSSLELEALRLELVNALNDLRVAEKTLRAVESASSSVAEQTILDARMLVRQRANAVEVAQSKWKSLGMAEEAIHSPATLPLRAQVGGTIVRADLSVGKVVDPWEHLFEIVDLSKIWVQIGVLEKDLPRVREGQSVELQLTAYPGERLPLHLRIKSMALEPGSHLNTVWAELDNPPGQEPRYLPGMSGQARILFPSERESKGWLVPLEAVIQNGVEPFVLIEEAFTTEHSEYRRKPVAIFQKTPTQAEIYSPELVPGDRVVTRGAHELGGYFVPGVVRLNPLAARTIGLQVGTVTEQTIEDVVEIDGQVDLPPSQRSDASAQLDGYVTALHVERGQYVRVGDLLAEISSLEFQSLQLDLLKEELTFQLLDQQQARLKAAAGVVPSRRLLELEAEHSATRNRRDNLRQRLSVLGISEAQIDELLRQRKLIDTLPVRASIEGYVVEFARVIGHVVKANEPLVTLHQLSRPYILAYVSERELSRVRLGQSARVRLVGEPDRLRAGHVVRTNRRFDPSDQTLSLWVQLDESTDYPLRHGQLARLSLVVASRPKSLAIPRSALLLEGTQPFVFVQHDDGTFDRRAIRTGYSDDRFVEIIDGLQLGEKIATHGIEGVRTAYVSVR